MLNDGLKAKKRQKVKKQVAREMEMAETAPGLVLKQPCAGCPPSKPRKPKKRSEDVN